MNECALQHLNRAYRKHGVEEGVCYVGKSDKKRKLWWLWIVVWERLEEQHCTPQWYFTVILQSDPGRHQSAINLTTRHHTTCGTQSAFLTTAHSGKVEPARGWWGIAERKKIAYFIMFLLCRNIHPFFTLWRGGVVLFSVLASPSSICLFILWTPLTIWHDLDPNPGHLYWSLIPLHITLMI